MPSTKGAAPIQRKADGGGNTGLASSGGSASAAGTELPWEMQARAEAALGHPLDGVRVHEGAEAGAVGALAFAQGTDIHFRPGLYDPFTSQGQALLGHELAHVVQQSQGRVSGGGDINVDPGLEGEADRLGAAVVSQKPPRGGHSNGCDCPSCGGGRARGGNVPGASRVSRHAAPIQRFCGAPGCSDPNCHDVGNHGFNHVYNLRNGPVYNMSASPATLGQGTGTNQTTRNYVNNPATTYPQQVRMSYSDGAQDGNTEFQNAPLGPGQRADAGHILGRQNGGYGGDPASVFPQNPPQNRGNSLNGVNQRHLWREHEDNVNNMARSGSNVNVSVALNNQPRQTYSPSTTFPNDEVSQWFSNAERRYQ